MNRIILMISRTCLWAGIVLVVITTVDVFINVVFRYLLSSPITWSDEIAVLMQVWFVFLPQIWLEFNDDQLYLTILTERITNARFRQIQKMAKLILIPCVYFFLAFYGFRFLLQSYQLETKTFILELPFWVVYSILPLSLCLSALARLGSLVAVVKESHVN